MKERRRLILASSSPYRRNVLSQLRLPFATASPDIDESPMPGESPRELVGRLAAAKAERVASDEPDAVIIGADQVAVIGDMAVSKPGHREAAVEQLRTARGRRMVFVNGICLLDARSGQRQQAIVEYPVRFRRYSEEELQRYLDADEPFDCAGSFRSEGMGMALLDGVEGGDPSALLGLPLVELCAMLRRAGFAVP